MTGNVQVEEDKEDEDKDGEELEANELVCII